MSLLRELWLCLCALLLTAFLPTHQLEALLFSVALSFQFWSGREMGLCFDRPGLPPRGHIKLSVIIRDTLVVVLDQKSISSANWGGGMKPN